MKKLFTLLFVAVAVIAARAKDYYVPITIIVNGTAADQTGVISVVENDGLVDLTVKNFMLQSSDGPMGVGNVVVKGIKPIQDGNATLLLTNQTITITAGDDSSVPFWMGPSIGEIPVELRGKIEGDRLRCYLDIDLRATLQQVIQVAIGDGYQIANSSFENWHTSTGEYVEPNAWHSFMSASGDFALLLSNQIEKSSDAHSGSASARIFSKDMFITIANGTMTTGRMNADAMSATDTKNHAYLDMSMTDVDGHGDPYYTTMCSKPDSIAAWVKFKQGTPNAAHPYATISAAITDGTRYQDPEDKEYTNVVGKAKNNTIATTDGQWVRVVAPFVYNDNAEEPKAVLVTISTNADAGQGSGDDEVLVDDIAFIYNAKVTGLKIKGQDVPQFDAKTTSYEMELNETITAADIEAAVDGKTAHVVKEVTTEDGGYLCRVTAINADMSVMSSYTVKVKSNAAGIHTLKTDASQPAAYFTLDGRQVTTLVPGTIYICRQADGTTTKIRR